MTTTSTPAARTAAAKRETIETLTAAGIDTSKAAGFEVGATTKRIALRIENDADYATAAALFPAATQATYAGRSFGYLYLAR